MFIGKLLADFNQINDALDNKVWRIRFKIDTKEKTLFEADNVIFLIKKSKILLNKFVRYGRIKTGINGIFVGCHANISGENASENCSTSQPPEKGSVAPPRMRRGTRRRRQSRGSAFETAKDTRRYLPDLCCLHLTQEINWVCCCHKP